MEKLGGGGHMNTAGAQVANSTMEEAIKLVKMTVEDMVANNEI